MGGNDLGFPNIAMGIFVPNVARHWYGWPGLQLFRFIAKAEDPSSVESRVARYGEIYAGAIHALRDAARVPANRTVLVQYPNPIVTEGQGGLKESPDGGCVGGDEVKLSNGKSELAQAIRVRDSNLVLGSAIYHVTPLHFGGDWTLSADRDEVKSFKRIYTSITKMQSWALSVPDSTGGTMAGATYGPPELFSGRRLCDELKSASAVYLPLHMCHTEACTAGSVMGKGQWLPRSPASYLHYSGMKSGQAKRMIVYSLNESVLAQRSWDDETPTGERIMDALSGAMHPTAEAYAAAADSVLNAIRNKER